MSYELTREVARRRAARIIAWGGSQVALPIFVVVALIRGLWIGCRNRLKVIHVGDPVLAAPGLVLSHALGVPVVVTVHGLDVTYPNVVYQLVVPRLLARTAALVAISRQARDELVKRGIAEDRCVVVPVGVSPASDPRLPRRAARDALRISHHLDLGEGLVLLTVGRLVPRKGVAWFIEHVLPMIVAEHAALQYLVVGDGPHRAAIARAIAAKGLEGHVILAGELPEAGLSAAYCAGDIFVMPNIPVAGDVEGFGIVALEAGLAECCVVAAEIEGLRDAVQDRRNGVFVPAGDARTMAETILRLLADAGERALIGREARQFVLDHYSWSSIADQYLRLFDRVAGSA